MKTIRITACVLLAALFLTVMVSCGGGNDPSLVGEWVAEVEGMEMTFAFNEDGTGTMGSMGVNFETTYKVVDGDTVEITMNIMGEKETTEFTYKIEGDKPSLTADGETLVFTKK